MKERVNSAAPADHAAVAQDKAQTVAFLQSLFGFLCSDQAAEGMLGSNPWVLATAVRLIGDYAAWFGKAADVPLEGALKYLLRGLSTQQVIVQPAVLPVCWQMLSLFNAGAPQPCFVCLLSVCRDAEVLWDQLRTASIHKRQCWPGEQEVDMPLAAVQAGRPAAKAFYNLCIRCAQRLRSPAIFCSLLDAASRPLESSMAGGSCRQAQI